MVFTDSILHSVYCSSKICGYADIFAMSYCLRPKSNMFASAKIAYVDSHDICKMVWFAG